MSERIDQLEYTVMELGAEMYRLKQELNQLSQSKEFMVKAFRKLQDILEEKGILDAEEFDLNTQLQEIFNLADALEDVEDTPLPAKHDLH